MVLNDRPYNVIQNLKFQAFGNETLLHRVGLATVKKIYDLRIDFIDDPNNHENIYGPMYKNTTANVNRINKSFR